MSAFTVLFVLLCLMTFSFFLGRSRARVLASAGSGRLHSLPSYHGLYVALWCGIPALLLMLAWLILEPIIAESVLISSISDQSADLTAAELSLLVNDIKNLALGNIVSREVDPAIKPRPNAMARCAASADGRCWWSSLPLAIFGIHWSRRLIKPELRARNQVERVFTIIMIVASGIAILTTVGIVLSLLFEALRFFARVPFFDFFFGLHWSPQTALGPIRSVPRAASGRFRSSPARF